jgi:hypothetical protein
MLQPAAYAADTVIGDQGNMCSAGLWKPGHVSRIEGRCRQHYTAMWYTGVG